MLNLVEFYIVVNSKTGEHETDIWKVVNKLFDVIRLCYIMGRGYKRLGLK